MANHVCEKAVDVFIEVYEVTELKVNMKKKLMQKKNLEHWFWVNPSSR